MPNRMFKSIPQRVLIDPIAQLAKWRWASILFTGILARVLIDTILALAIPQYALFSWQGMLNYAYTIAFAFIILEGNRLINQRLNGLSPWEIDTRRRFMLQALANAIYTMFILNALRPALFVLFMPDRQNALAEQLVVNIVAIGLVLIVALIDFGLFLLTRWQNTLLEIEQFKKESIEFQLGMLRSQVNPHFLFNSLNTLSSLIYQDTEKAATFVRGLAKVYRHVLEHQEDELIPLKEELHILESYLGLQKVRFGDALLVEIQLPAESMNQLIVPLTLQMLLENAVKHNAKTKKKPLHIRIGLDERGKLSIVNNRSTQKEEPFSSGIGLKNIRSRYGFLTQEKVEILQNEQQFCVKIPLIPNPERGLIT